MNARIRQELCYCPCILRTVRHFYQNGVLTCSNCGRLKFPAKNSAIRNLAGELLATLRTVSHRERVPSGTFIKRALSNKDLCN